MSNDPELKKWWAIDIGSGFIVEREDGKQEQVIGAHCKACALAKIVSKNPEADVDLRGLHRYGSCYQFLAVMVRQRRRGIDNDL